MTKGNPFYSFHSLLLLIIGFTIGLFWANYYHPWPVFAEYPDMTMNATPNPVGSGARAMGMGGAFISIADDATAASWNPGGLLQLKKPEVSMVGSFFSGKIDYHTSRVRDGGIEDDSPDKLHLNYFSMVIPFMMMRRNIVFSLNYQHFYEFSKDNIIIYKIADIPYRSHKKQRGSLNTLSPAFAFQVTPFFSIGITANFWSPEALDNGWQNINIVDGEGEIYGRAVTVHTEVYERYDFSGFNMHLGFLFKSKYFRFLRKKRKFRIGGIIKTPFQADILHEQREISYIIYPDNAVLSSHSEPHDSHGDLTLNMPLSYGVGFSFDFSDEFSVALDGYHTHWEDYLIKYPSGKEYSPINREPKEKADIQSTTQVRLGAEYVVRKPKAIIPFRMGAFYDPEPAGGRADDFLGASLGIGMTYKELFSLDFAYQYRFGDKKKDEYMQGEDISSQVRQHYFYASAIYYLF